MSDGILSSGHIVTAPRSRAAFVGSYAAQVVAGFLLVQFCVVAPTIETQIKPRTDLQYIPLAPQPASEPTPRAVVKPIVHAPETVVQAVNVRGAAPPKRVMPEQPDPKPVQMKVSQTVLPDAVTKPMVVKPQAPVITGGFSAGSSATPTVK